MALFLVTSNPRWRPATISEKFDRKLRPNGYRYRNGHNGESIVNHHRSFEWCHRRSSTTPSPKMGFHINPRYANGHISATGDQIHFMFVTRLGFSSCFGHYNRSCLLTYLLSGSADRMALFPVTLSWRQVLPWIIWNGHISATADSIHLSRIARSSLR